MHMCVYVYIYIHTHTYTLNVRVLRYGYRYVRAFPLFVSTCWLYRAARFQKFCQMKVCPSEKQLEELRSIGFPTPSVPAARLYLPCRSFNISCYFFYLEKS